MFQTSKRLPLTLALAPQSLASCARIKRHARNSHQPFVVVFVHNCMLQGLIIVPVLYSDCTYTISLFLNPFINPLLYLLAPKHLALCDSSVPSQPNYPPHDSEDTSDDTPNQPDRDNRHPNGPHDPQQHPLQ